METAETESDSLWPVRPDPAFRTTQWGVIQQACSPDSPAAAQALDQFCECYWYPLYAFVRRKGHPPEDAKDLTQMFFARLLEKDLLGRADPGRGRLRSFLLKSLQHFLITEWQKSRTERRGAGAALVPWDSPDFEELYEAEPAVAPDAEGLYDKRWANAVLQRVLIGLREHYRSKGNEQAYEALKGFLSAEPPVRSQASVAEELGLSEGAVAVMIHRLRAGFRKLLREEVGRTVADPSEIDDEIRYLARVMLL